jgi:hypothetical protein
MNDMKEEHIDKTLSVLLPWMETVGVGVGKFSTVSNSKYSHWMENETIERVEWDKTASRYVIARTKLSYSSKPPYELMIDKETLFAKLEDKWVGVVSTVEHHELRKLNGWPITYDGCSAFSKFYQKIEGIKTRVFNQDEDALVSQCLKKKVESVNDKSVKKAAELISRSGVLFKNLEELKDFSTKLCCLRDLYLDPIKCGDEGLQRILDLAAFYSVHEK